MLKKEDFMISLLEFIEEMVLKLVEILQKVL